jgi:hypothetical protein
MSQTSPSAAYTRLVTSIEGVSAEFRESIDTEAFLALSGDEKSAAEELLVQRMKDVEDFRIPPVLARIRLKRAVRPMKERLGQTKGRMRIALARALVELDALPRIDETVAAMIAENDADEGLTALAATPGLRSREIGQARARACLHHSSPEVRINAGAALLRMAKLTTDPLVWKFRPLYLALGDADEAVRREAFEAICELTELPPEAAD